MRQISQQPPDLTWFSLERALLRGTALPLTSAWFLTGNHKQQNSDSSCKPLQTIKLKAHRK